MSLAHSTHVCRGAGRSTRAQGAGESSLLEQPVTVPHADREAGQEQSREHQPVLLGKPVAPSALQELLGTGSGITPLRTSFTSCPACGIAAGAPLWVHLGAGHPKKGTLVPQPLRGLPQLPVRAGTVGQVGVLLQRGTGSKRVYFGRQ